MAALGDLIYKTLVYLTIVSLGGFLLGPLLAMVTFNPLWLLWFVWAFVWLLILLW